MASGCGDTGRCTSRLRCWRQRPRSRGVWHFARAAVNGIRRGPRNRVAVSRATAEPAPTVLRGSRCPRRRSPTCRRGRRPPSRSARRSITGRAPAVIDSGYRPGTVRRAGGPRPRRQHPRPHALRAGRPPRARDASGRGGGGGNRPHAGRARRRAATRARRSAAFDRYLAAAPAAPCARRRWPDGRARSSCWVSGRAPSARGRTCSRAIRAPRKRPLARRRLRRAPRRTGAREATTDDRGRGSVAGVDAVRGAAGRRPAMGCPARRRRGARIELVARVRSGAGVEARRVCARRS